MLNTEDKETVRYLRMYPNALNKEAADLIERLHLENMLLKRKMRDFAAELND